MMRLGRAIAVAMLPVLAGCGIIYQSARVPGSADDVTVLRLTAPVVASANADPYVPRALPAVFSQVADAAPEIALDGATVPPATLERPVRPGELALIPPPPAPNGPYMIGIGDVVLLATTAAGNTVEELSGLLAAENRRQGYTVQDDGAIAIPDVGRVDLAGLTIEEAEDAVFRALVSAQIEPAFSLEVTGFNSRRVPVGGAVTRPAVVPITITELTLAEALAAAGGVAATAPEFVLIRIYRDGTLYQIPLEDYLARPELQDIRLVDGDSVFVGLEYDLSRAEAFFSEQIRLSTLRATARSQALAELRTAVELRRGALQEERTNFQAALAVDGVERDYVYLTGEVTVPSRFPLPFEQQATLNDALFGGAGGIAQATGNPAHIYVLRDRDGDGDVTAFRLDGRNAANLTLASRFEMRPGDVVFVAEQAVTRWNRVVAQITPALINTGIALSEDD